MTRYPAFLISQISMKCVLSSWSRGDKRLEEAHRPIGFIHFCLLSADRGGDPLSSSLLIPSSPFKSFPLPPKRHPLTLVSFCAPLSSPPFFFVFLYPPPDTVLLFFSSFCFFSQSHLTRFGHHSFSSLLLIPCFWTPPSLFCLFVISLS